MDDDNKDRQDRIARYYQDRIARCGMNVMPARLYIAAQVLQGLAVSASSRAASLNVGPEEMREKDAAAALQVADVLIRQHTALIRQHVEISHGEESA
tara:strand:+ start:220 stop:510 length:291 start_codon:yes stop_codon:yes gene_type:complete